MGAHSPLLLLLQLGCCGVMGAGMGACLVLGQVGQGGPRLQEGLCACCWGSWGVVGSRARLCVLVVWPRKGCAACVVQTAVLL